jgi:hypothetical protein
MELTPQILRMTFYGNCDHSGNVWTELKGATNGLDTTTGLDGTAHSSTVNQRQNAGFAATVLQGDTPRGRAHVA